MRVFNSFNTTLLLSLWRLSKTNTKAFWKTVHKFSNRKKEDPSVEIETFYDYFKKLNAGDATQLISVIARKLSGSDGFPLFL
jgi:hypothetical protein